MSFLIMKNRTKRIQQFLAHELLIAYKNDKITLTLYHILDKVTKRYKLYMCEIDDAKTGFDVRGHCSDGYWIIIDTIYIIEKMTKADIIQYYEQGNVQNPFPKDGIGKDEPDYSQSAKVTGSFAKHIYDNLRKSIWISSDIENFVKNGFVPEELSLAREQTQDAKCTLKWAIATFFITAIATIYNIIQVDAKCSITIHFCPLVITILILVLCILFNLNCPFTRRMTCNWHRRRK